MSTPMRTTTGLGSTTTTTTTTTQNPTRNNFEINLGTSPSDLEQTEIDNNNNNNTSNNNSNKILLDGDKNKDGNMNERDRFTSLPRHDQSSEINKTLEKTEAAIQKLYDNSIGDEEMGMGDCDLHQIRIDECDNEEMQYTQSDEKVYANSYVDLGKVDTVGFDYDYTLVTYKEELLELIYDMTLNRLVKEYQYPPEMLEAGLKFDPSFSIRGLAVDRETAWICHLSYTHKVSVAYEGREKVSRERLIKEYRGKRSLTPNDRKKRLKPLNDLFSMAECCLIADVVQFFHDYNIPFCPKNAVVDILDAIGRTHISGDFHRLVSDDCCVSYFISYEPLLIISIIDILCHHHIIPLSHYNIYIGCRRTKEIF
jgi:hypothetical protein